MAVVRTASTTINDEDDNPRPLKRQRGAPSPSLSPTASPASTSAFPLATAPDKPLQLQLQRLPPARLLLALPALVLHPRTHKLHLRSIALAQHALRRCLALATLEPSEECRAWSGLAELGVMWLDACDGEGNISEVEGALTKALLLSQKHPSLRLYTPHLTLLSARLAQTYQANPKFAAHTLKRLLASLSRPAPSQTYPAHVLFSAHLGLVHSYWCAAEEDAATCTGNGNGNAKGKAKASGAVQKCLSALEDMRTAAAAALGPTNAVVLLALVVRLQLLVRHGMWADVPGALDDAEQAFEFEGGPETPPVLRVQMLMLGVVFHTYAGDAEKAGERLRVLHALLDTGVLGHAKEDGVIEIPFPDAAAPPLRIHATPPRVMHALAFLLSAVAKRDAVGRAPKKGVFARAGLGLREFAMGVGEMIGMTMGGEGRRESERRATRKERIKADLLGEVVAISIMRSEFIQAQSTLDTLVAHTRTHHLFPAYAARIALMHAQLAHAKGEAERAVRCYRVAGWVASGSAGAGAGEIHEGQGEREKDEWVRAAARAGEVWVRLGMVRRRRDDGDVASEMEELRTLAKVVVEECEGLGGTLMAVAEVLRACLGEEFVAAKQHLRRALDLATRAQDNHLRALVLALVAAHYLHTAREHAMAVLGTCGQLAAGLGAVRAGAGVGNAPLRLWVGERVVELHRWAGEGAMAERQERVNERVREACRGGAGVGVGVGVGEGGP
ncbi:hypothetical protein LshimejAT787_1403130 [Lyophyllum shimeji]|uniref:Cohesin loading factor n=1 Tax=Lyophyllum shimeji TaxID=47721 RepID=A0A9P3PZ71_LYOSH|nr:hypothetical protein LshimejAT787_1403130 [Lyophyllum shimeji]